MDGEQEAKNQIQTQKYVDLQILKMSVKLLYGKNNNFILFE